VSVCVRAEADSAGARETTNRGENPDGRRIAIEGDDLDGRTFGNASPVLQCSPDDDWQAERVGVPALLCESMSDELASSGRGGGATAHTRETAAPRRVKS
jgi:hypothetical protein